MPSSRGALPLNTAAAQRPPLSPPSTPRPPTMHTERESWEKSLRLHVEPWLHHFLAPRLALSEHVNNLCLTFLIRKTGIILIMTL